MPQFNKMTGAPTRRSVDWSRILGTLAKEPALTTNAAQVDLAALLSAFNALPQVDRPDAICRRAVELARSHLGLPRVSVFLMDQEGKSMLGTWGTNLRGETVDERHVMFDVTPSILDIYGRAEAGERVTVLDDCALVVHHLESTEVVGRGWVACTPIRWGQTHLGMIFNDAGLSGAPIDPVKQGLLAILSLLLASSLAFAPSERAAGPSGGPLVARHQVVRKTTDMLAADPRLVAKELAATLGISASRLGRLFKAEVGMSLVEYRNRLRIERFRLLVDAGEQRLHQVARAAGFGSYAQFHRVFRATHGATPRDYVLAERRAPERRRVAGAAPSALSAAQHPT